MNLVDVIIDEVRRTNDQIRQDIPKDEGKAAQSIHIELHGNEIQSVGSSYIEYLDRGSAPWKNPEQYKKLGYILDKSGWADRNNTSAYAAAYSIAHKGSQIYQGKKTGIQLDQKLKDLSARLAQKIPKFVADNIKTQMKWNKIGG